MNVVYVSPNGAGTALVRSQVLPYLHGLTGRGATFDLVTFERSGDPPFPDAEFPRAHWHGLQARAGGRLVARAFEVLAGAAQVLVLVLHRRARLLHARSYLPAALVWAVTRVTRSPYIFDMRGFLGDEYTEGRHWTRTDLRFRVLSAVERLLLRGAAGIVVLTDVAAARLHDDPRFARAVGEKPVVVVSCAVDLTRFAPRANRSQASTLVYSGSLGMSYALDPMLRVYAEARRRAPGLRFLILNRSDHDLVSDAIARLRIDASGIEVRSAAFDDVPALLAEARVGICLLEQVSSKRASSPIKIGEYLAAGLPVIVNRGQGDIAAQVEEFRAGHVIDRYDDDLIQWAGEAVVALLEDLPARANARRLAETHYNLPSAVDVYWSLYEEVTGGRAVSR